MNGGPIISEKIFFGDPWDEVEGWRQVGVPTGMKCVECGHQIAKNEQGIFQVKSEGPFVDWYPKHRTCEPGAQGH